MTQTEEAPLKFRLSLEEKPVELEDPETGKTKSYVLKEMGGQDRAEYVTLVSSRTDKDGYIKNFVGIDEDLLSRSLFEKTSNGLRGVSAEEVGKWPSHITRALAQEARRLSGLIKKEDDKEKNS